MNRTAKEGAMAKEYLVVLFPRNRRVLRVVQGGSVSKLQTGLPGARHSGQADCRAVQSGQLVQAGVAGIF